MPLPDAGGATPEPLSATLCGLPGALSRKVNVPDRVPVPVGVNVTATVHVSLDARLVQVDTCAKSPLTDIVSVSGSAPVFVTFTSCAGAVVDTVCDPNVNVPGKTAIADAGAAADARLSVCPIPTAITTPATRNAGRYLRILAAAARTAVAANHQSINGDGIAGRGQRNASSRGPPALGGASDDEVVEMVMVDRAPFAPGVTVSGLKLHDTPGGRVPVLQDRATSVE